MFYLIYFAVINFIAVIMCVYDKNQSRICGCRLSERLLFAVSIIGGAVGMYLTMRLIRHKTLHKRFMIGLPIIIALQLAVVYYLTNRFADITI